MGADSLDRTRAAGLLTDRSLKFYDGTYKWDSDGFTDEQGVYRKFDSGDPEAGPPTPRPPTPVSDEDDSEMKNEDSGIELGFGEHVADKSSEDREGHASGKVRVLQMEPEGLDTSIQLQPHSLPAHQGNGVLYLNGTTKSHAGTGKDEQIAPPETQVPMNGSEKESLSEAPNRLFSPPTPTDTLDASAVLATSTEDDAQAPPKGRKVDAGKVDGDSESSLSDSLSDLSDLEADSLIRPSEQAESAEVNSKRALLKNKTSAPQNTKASTKRKTYDDDDDDDDYENYITSKARAKPTPAGKKGVARKVTRKKKVVKDEYRPSINKRGGRTAKAKEEFDSGGLEQEALFEAGCGPLVSAFQTLMAGRLCLHSVTVASNLLRASKGMARRFRLLWIS
ncbi:hypothetical protein BDV95DRAFT_596782 [Massariosphaeria phaeospora]|uniref:Uncharacterized protein n=1 Tax=Massariosphaeria phaeospora TaxID=100035 RepID=A0A7C8M5N8_9PLEO|nr:hypothetical protein BDV95DRAFT_596782 [Massariosphaeria phaeospora]